MGENGKRSRWIIPLGLVVCAVLVRGGVLWRMQDSLAADPDGYREIAQGIIKNAEFARRTMYAWRPTPFEPTAYRPPLYPLFLLNYTDRGLITPFAIARCHFIFGVGTVLLTYHLARRWQLSEGLAALAAVLVMIDPILLRQSTLVMTETLAAFLAVLALVALTRYASEPSLFYAALAGGLLGVCAMCRPTFYLWFVLLLPVVLLVPRERWRREANVAAFVAMALVIVSPWAVRNYVQLGKPIFTTTHGGYTLALGNNASFYQYLHAGDWNTPWSVEESPLQREIWQRFGAQTTGRQHYEVELDNAAYEVAYDSIRQEPGNFIWSCLYRLRRFWGVMPFRTGHSESTYITLGRMAIAAWYVATLLLALLGAASLREKLLQTPWLFGLLLCVAFTLPHLFYWSDLRMRAPLVPAIALATAVGWGVLQKWSVRHKTPETNTLQVGGSA